MGQRIHAQQNQEQFPCYLSQESLLENAWHGKPKSAHPHTLHTSYPPLRVLQPRALRLLIQVNLCIYRPYQSHDPNLATLSRARHDFPCLLRRAFLHAALHLHYLWILMKSCGIRNSI